MIFFEIIEAEATLRPLLIASGVAIAAAGIYYCLKRSGESTMEPTTTTPTQGHCTLYEDSFSMDPDSMSFEAGVNITHSDDSTDYEDSLAEAEKRYEKVLELNRQLERKYSYVAVKEKVLLEHLSQSRTGYKDLRNKHDKVVQAHRKMKVHYNRIKEDYNELIKKHKQEQLCLAQAIESNARLEKENIDLLAQMSTLRCTMRQLKEEFFDARRKFAEKRDQEQDLGTGILNLSPTNEERLVGSLAEIESKLMKVINVNSMLAQERADLNNHVRVLRDTVQELEEMLSDSKRKYNTVNQEKEQLMQVHNMLKMRHHKMLESIRSAINS